MSNLDKVLADLGFPSTQYEISGFTSISNLIPLEKRCGIYVLHCSNDELYAGLSINVVERYKQHLENHNDIVKLSFKCVSPDELGNEEKRVIRTLEKAGFHLRNIVYTSHTYASAVFDEIMLPSDQKRWVNDLTFQDFSGERQVNDELRRKYLRKYERLIEMPHADEIIAVLREYVRTGIPAVIRTEMDFWNCSCLPGDDKRLYARINIYQQEVFAAYLHEGRLLFAWNLALSQLEVSFRRFRMIRPTIYLKHPVQFIDQKYVPGGEDQIVMEAQASLQEAINIIHDPNVLRAVRLFNLTLMKKGATWYSRYHCFDLADRLIS